MRKDRKGINWVLALSLLLGGGQALGFQPAQPTTREGPVEATLVDVQGRVQVRENEDRPWQMAQPGMVLGEGAEFRTGPRSSVTFVIPPDQTITVDRLGVVKLVEAVRQGGVLKTDLGMMYGRARYSIEAAGEEHDAVIRSPGSTLAIRGTSIIYEDQAPWTPTLTSLQGSVRFRTLRRQMVAVGGDRQARIRAEHNSAGQTERQETRVDSRGAFAGRTGDENERIEEQLAVSVLDHQGLQAVQALARLGDFRGTFFGVAPVPGPLRFDLLWDSIGTPGLSNLDLLVTDPRGNTASAGSPVIGTGTAMGTHSGDNRGSQVGGVERVEWALFFPPGVYQFEVRHVSGAPAQTFIDVTRDRDTITSIGRKPKNPLILQPGQTFRGSATVR